jgi:hypothetical protein
VADELDSLRRVLMNPPPIDLEAAVRARVNAIAGDLGPSNRGAIISVATTAGVNLAIVARAGDHFFVKGYIAKEWGAPLDAGGAVEVKW